MGSVLIACFLIVCELAVSRGFGPLCERGWHQIGSSCLRQVDGQFTYDEARQVCVGLESDLATADSDSLRGLSRLIHLTSRRKGWISGFRGSDGQLIRITHDQNIDHSDNHNNEILTSLHCWAVLHGNSEIQLELCTSKTRAVALCQRTYSAEVSSILSTHDSSRSTPSSSNAALTLRPSRAELNSLVTRNPGKTALIPLLRGSSLMTRSASPVDASSGSPEVPEENSTTGKSTHDGDLDTAKIAILTQSKPGFMDKTSNVIATVGAACGAAILFVCITVVIVRKWHHALSDKVSSGRGSVA